MNCPQNQKSGLDLLHEESRFSRDHIHLRSRGPRDGMNPIVVGSTPSCSLPPKKKKVKKKLFLLQECAHTLGWMTPGSLQGMKYGKSGDGMKEGGGGLQDRVVCLSFILFFFSLGLDHQGPLNLLDMIVLSGRAFRVGLGTLRGAEQ